MQRYCPQCRKSFEFKIKSMAERDNLICPECGSKIDPNSRSAPNAVKSQRNDADLVAATAFSVYSIIRWYFYAAVSIFGIIAYNMHWDIGLYIATGLCLFVFCFRFLFMGGFFRNISWLAAGGALSFFFIEQNIKGICLGILIVLLIKHVIKEILARLFRWLIDLGNS